MGWLLNLLWLAPAAWLLFGMPWLEGRRKAKFEREQKARDLVWEMRLLYAERGREGLEAKLLADLQAVMAHSVLRSVEPGEITVDLLGRALHGDIPESVQDVQLRRPDDEFTMYFWPRTRPPRVKR